MSTRRKPEPPKAEKVQPAPEPKPETVYYIVEKKKSKKATYSEPKEINFKK